MDGLAAAPGSEVALAEVQKRGRACESMSIGRCPLGAGWVHMG